MLQALHCSGGGTDYPAIGFRGLKSMQSFLRRLSGDQRAVTAIEYSLIICLIGSAAMGAMTFLGHTLLNVSGPVASALH
jgi:Flp pilus assembly pilin Flp